MAAWDFANGEIFVRPEESVRGSDAFVIQSHTTPINHWVMETLILVDALKRASAKRITVVAPFYPYARQDKKHRGREPISARLMADLLKTAGADRIMSIDLHTAQIQGFFDGPVDHLFALPLLAEYVSKTYAGEQLTVVSPDTGRVRAAEQWADRIGGAPIAFIHKTRDPNVANQVVANRVVGDVAGRLCILADDMIDTGGSIVKAADLLYEAGAADVIIAATHGDVLRAGRRPAEELPGPRGDHHQHAADPAGAAVRQAHRHLDRADDRPCDQGSLRGRLGHQPVRRPQLTCRSGCFGLPELGSFSRAAAIRAKACDVEGLAASGRVDAGRRSAVARPRHAEPAQPASAERSILRRWAKAASMTANTSLPAGR